MIWGTKNFKSTKIRVFALCILLVMPLTGFGQDYGNKRIVEIDGKVGIFFDEETATRMLQDLAEFKKLKDLYIPTLESKVKLKDLEIGSLKLNIEVTEQIGDKWKESFTDSEKLRQSETAYLRNQLNKKEVWYLRPGTIFIMGFVVGSAAMIGLSFGLNEALK